MPVAHRPSNRLVSRSRIRWHWLRPAALTAAVGLAVACPYSSADDAAPDEAVNSGDPDAARAAERVVVLPNVDDALVCRDGEFAAVLFFVLHDCPIANALMPEMNAIISDFEKQGFRFTFVHVDPAVRETTIRKHASDFGARAPIVVDRQHALVRKFGPEITPEAVVVSPKGDVWYCGRINDLFTALGQRRAKPRHEELREVLGAVAAGRKVTTPPERGVGCYIADLRPKMTGQDPSDQEAQERSSLPR